MQPERRFDACVIAASQGGIQALQALFAGLRPDLPLALLVVQHNAGSGAGMMAAVLGRGSALPVQEAQSGMMARAGHIVLAAPGYHLLVEYDRSLSLSADPRVRHVRPAADVLFDSAADVWRERLIGVVLTGSNDDGARGLNRVRERGGYALVQSPQEAEAPQMPQAALTLAGADEVLLLTDLAKRINQLA